MKKTILFLLLSLAALVSAAEKPKASLNLGEVVVGDTSYRVVPRARIKPIALGCIEGSEQQVPLPVQIGFQKLETITIAKCTASEGVAVEAYLDTIKYFIPKPVPKPKADTAAKGK